MLEATLVKDLRYEVSFLSKFRETMKVKDRENMTDLSNKIDSTIFLFVVLSAEVHGPLHGCDDPALCHHAAS